MFIPFHEISDSSRLWVYQCNRTLTKEEAEYLSISFAQFLEDWKAHGKPLTCSCSLRENMFLIVAVDEEASNASGCSIDASVHELQSLQAKLEVDFFGRDFVVFKKGDELFKIRTQELKDRISKGELTPETAMFNTLVSSKAQLDAQWLVPAGSTWLARYFKTVNT